MLTALSGHSHLAPAGGESIHKRRAIATAIVISPIPAVSPIAPNRKGIVQFQVESVSLLRSGLDRVFLPELLSEGDRRVHRCFGFDFKEHSGFMQKAHPKGSASLRAKV